MPAKAVIAVIPEPIKATVMIDPKIAVCIEVHFEERATFEAGEVLRVKAKLKIKNISWPLKIEIKDEKAEVIIKEDEA